MQLTVPIVCAVATFVLISDHLRIAAASGDAAKSSKLLRARRDEKYTTKYDDIDVDRILNSERLLKSYIKCLLDKGPCPSEGRDLKKFLPDALQTDCSKCSEVQKRQGGRILTFILQNYREDWNMLVDKYDPEGTFRKKYGYEEEEDENEADEGEDAKRK